MRLICLFVCALSSAVVQGSLFVLSKSQSQKIISEIDNIWPYRHEVFEFHPEHKDLSSGLVRPLCVLHSLGEGADDSYNFEKAVHQCGRGGIVRLPDANYTISRPLDIYLSNSILDLHGWLSFSTNISSWIENRMPLDFQNQSLAFVVRGNDYILEGNDKGGINGNGQVWYDYAKDYGNKFGRPMSLAIKNSKNVIIKNFSIVQPQFWASLIWGSENVYIKDFYVNATSYNPESASDQKNWLQNTDGSDTYQSHNVTYENMVYQGGDDCVALKPNSTSITLRNVTCYGGTGIAFGSIAQYSGVKDVIEDVFMEDIQLYPSNQCPAYQGVYFKSWLGYSIGQPPNGGGGGYGYCRNVTVKDVYMENIWHPLVVQSDLTYLTLDREKYADSGLFEWYDIHLKNFTGKALRNRIAWMSCSKLTPCHDWTFEGIDIMPGKRDHPEIHYTCNNFVLGGNDGLNQCHPSNSKLETENGGTL
ncbi:polygalacturonase, putative [Cryptococcus gattii WM276]|uniref:galacturonan 1,4-alpha-galacturonidase n=1 Tax=Cryptococcus gattii serotype B (strain WM276 / ATCC MYA-4071) TaxID=367775 RepID=E6R3B7_CRYGW|nr:polygalacturonase, putative [Cryptococcus gattii WM276]ADV21054.1 polygalacturonase, putative [Cryptococcus gattii WM276]KJE02100.1 polygalacturonase [Cryptococcus gattii NT-10]